MLWAEGPPWMHRAQRNHSKKGLRSPMLFIHVTPGGHMGS